MHFIVLFIKHNTFYVLYVAFFCIYAQNNLTSLHSNTEPRQDVNENLI